jgi:hypothetical protein
MSDLRDELEALVASPGWAWLVRTERAHWEDQAERYLKAAAGETDDRMALNKLRQVIAARDAVARVFQRPDEKIRDLRSAAEHASAAPPLSRRGLL